MLHRYRNNNAIPLTQLHLQLTLTRAHGSLNLHYGDQSELAKPQDQINHKLQKAYQVN